MIGVIGGNGVAATNKLLELIEEIYTINGAFRDSHHPEMIIWQATQAPSRSLYLEGRGKSFIEDYIDIGLKLKQCGCTKLCICCNTAHYALDILQRQIGLPFINILAEVAKYVNFLKCKKVGIMCTDGLRNVGLYEKYFKIFAPDTQVLFPTDEMQMFVTQGICNAKNTKRYLELSNEQSPQNCFSKVCNWLLEQECDCIVAGCTDICNVFTKEMTENVKYIDSLEILAEAIYKEVKK